MDPFDMDRNGIIDGIDFFILDELLLPKEEKKNAFFDDHLPSDEDDDKDNWLW